MEYEKQAFQMYRQGKTVLDQFYMDEDYNVPDAKSDVKRVILSEGSVRVEELKLAESYVQVRGNLKFAILYAADEETGGLSGAPLRERSTEVVRLIAEHVKGEIPIIASGGVMTGADAIEKLEAGAQLVQLFTGFIYNGPKLVADCVEALAAWRKSGR